MSTLKFLRALADELGTSIEHLDDTVTEYVMSLTDSNVELAARVYREYTEDRCNP